MRLLTILSLIYAGVLVVALATSLILIARALFGISRVLARIRSALEEVSRQTELLEPNLGLLAKEVEATKENIARTHRALGPIVDPLSKAAEKLGLTEAVPRG